jgi:GT2 family glycosyltransferase
VADAEYSSRRFSGEMSASRRIVSAPSLRAAADAAILRVLFDFEFYVSRNPDIARSGLDALTHYVQFGWREGRSPHPLFDVGWYLRRYPDIAESAVEPLGYFLTQGARRGHDPHWCFDTDFYLARIPDGHTPISNPLVHYLTEGAVQGFDPHPLFDTKWYLEQNPDVASRRINPLVHFVLKGEVEGRSPHPLVDLKWYRSQYKDAPPSGQNLLAHLLSFAGTDLRNPSPNVDLKSFSQRFPSGPVHPLIHYALHADKLLKGSLIYPALNRTAAGETQWPGEAAFWRRCAEVERQRRDSFHPRPLDLIRCEVGAEEHFLRELDFSRPSKPSVSVILPVFNDARAALECLASLQRLGNEVNYEVIIADDASRGEQSEILARVIGATCLRNEKTLGLTLNCNSAARSARGDCLLFLHPDVQLLPGALAALVGSFDPEVGIVGPKTVSPSGRLRQAGCRFDVDGTTLPIGLNDDPALPPYNFRRSVESISGACLLIRRTLFEELNGFDSAHTPAYAAIDLCLRVRDRGLRVIYEPMACVCQVSKTSTERDQSALDPDRASTGKLPERWRKRIESDHRVSVIALYLPQFHAIPENDRWWGPGFTEWTNVARATPNYIGHDQPQHPADLGYYDLENPKVFPRQIALARRCGISAFSFYYYWFKNGRRILEMPIERYLADRSLDFPFCLTWANENWTRRWDGAEHDVLLEQGYSEADDLGLIRDVARFFADPRYVRIHGRPLFSIYRWALLPDPKATAERWRAECRRLGIGEIYLCAVESFDDARRLRHPADIGCDATIGFPPHDLNSERQVPVEIINPNFEGFVDDYVAVAVRSATRPGKAFTRFPGVTPRWDNTPRRQDNPYILDGSDPGAFKAWLEHSFDTVRKLNGPGERFVFVNAWNEWAEGAYLEPDARYGHGYLDAIRQALEASIARRSS